MTSGTADPPMRAPDEIPGDPASPGPPPPHSASPAGSAAPTTAAPPSPAPRATPRRRKRAQGNVGLILGHDRITLFETVSSRKEIRLERLAVARLGGAPGASISIDGASGSSDVEGIEFFRAAREVVARSGILPRKVIVSLPEGCVSQQVLPVPVMNRKTLRQVLKNKVRAVSGKDPDSVVWNFVSLGVVREESADREDILLVSVPRATLLQYYSVLRRVGINVEAFTTPQFASLSIFLGSKSPGASDAAVLSVGPSIATLTILRGGRIQFLREIPLPATADPAAAADRILYEVHRSLLFFQQKFPDRSVERLRIVHDDHGRAQAISELFREKLDLEVEVVDPLALLRGDDEILSRARAEVAGLTTLAGLTLHDQLRKKQRLGLMPTEVKEKRLHVTVDAITLSTILLAGAIAAFCDRGIERSIELKRGLINGREQEMLSLSGYDVQVAAIEARMDRVAKREAEHRKILERSPDWSRLATAFSRAVPETLRLGRLSVLPDPNGSAVSGPFRVTLSGATLKDPGPAGTDLLRLKDSLSHVPDLGDVEVRLAREPGRPSDEDVAKDPDALHWQPFDARAALLVPSGPADAAAARPPDRAGDAEEERR